MELGPPGPLLNMRKLIPTTVGTLSVVVLLFSVFSLGALMIAYDVWVFNRWGVDATISRGMERLWYAWPGVAFLMGIILGLIIGMLAGHFGMPQPPEERET